MTDTSNGLSSEQIEELKRRKAERDKRSAAFNDQRNAALETDAPDDAAYDLKKSQEFGIPREAIGGARDEYKNDDMLAAMEKMRSQAPRTSEWMRTPENYAVARDDMETFSKIEKDLDPWLTPGGGRLMAIGKSASEFGKAVGRFGKAGLMSAGSSLVDVDREQLEKASRYYDDYDAWSAREAERKSRGEGGVMNRLGWSSINLPKLTPTGNTMFSMPKLDGTFKLPVPGDTDPMPQVPAAISDVYMSERFRQQKEAGGFAAPLAKDQYLYGREMALAVRPLIAEKVDEAIRVSQEANKQVDELSASTGDFVADSLLGGVRSLTEMVPLIASAIITRGKTAPTAVMLGQVYYNEYATGREKGLEIDQATERAVLQAGVETISERISLGIVDNVLKDGGPLALRFTKGLILEQGQEQVATMGGRLVDWAYLEKDKTIQEFINETPRAMLQTALSTLVASSGMQATFLAADYATRKLLGDSVMSQPSAGDDLIANVMEKFAKANLGKRSPEKAADLVNKIVEGTGAETVVVDLDGLAQSLTTAGMDVREVLTQLGVDPDAIGELGQLMGTAEIPMGRLATASAQSVSAQIIPHMRLATEDLTPFQKTELEGIAELAKRYATELKEDVARDSSKLGAFMDVQEQIYTAAKGSGLNLTEEQYRHSANVEATRVAYVAMKRGQDVREAWAELGPKIMGRAGAQPQTQGSAALEQKADEMRTRLDEAWTSSRTMQPKEAARVWKNAVEEFKTFAASASAQELIAASDMLLDRDLLIKMEAPKLQKMMKTLGLPAPAPTMAMNEMRDAITAVLRSPDASLAQSIRASVRMPMAEVDAWVRDNVDSNFQDFQNGDESAVMTWNLTEDPDSPQVMMGIRLSLKGRADVNLFLDSKMADAMDNVEDVSERRRLANDMFSQAILVMRKYEAETPDLKAFNFIAAESQAEGTNPKSREQLYRSMLSTLKMDGYTAYEVTGQMSVVNTDADGAKVANPLFTPGSKFVLIKDGVDVNEFAKTEILRGTQRGGDAGEVVTALKAVPLTRSARGGVDGGGRDAGQPDPGRDGQQGAEGLSQPRRGGYDPKTREMSFTGISDASTFLHENAHWFLATLEELAPTEKWAADDLAEINAWYQSIREAPRMQQIRARYSVVPDPAGGVRIMYQPPADMIGEVPAAMRLERVASMEEAEARIEWRERQEAWAETTEEYFMTGEAPTPRLLQILRDFKSWLVQVYRGMLPGERANLTPEIKSMMDRILAVDVEVDAASAEVFRDARKMSDEMLGKGIITPRQHKLVGDRLDKAREEVKEEMLARVMQQKLEAGKAERETERTRIKGDLARAFDKSPVGRAFNWLAFGEWKGDLPNEPGTMSPEAADARSNEEVFQGGTLGQSAARLQGRPLAIQGTGPGGRVLNWDLGMAFTARHMKKYGRALDPAKPADYKIILKSMLEDFKEQSAQQDTGDAWYTDDINEAILLTSRIYPEMNTSPQFRDLFLTVTALLSPQQKPVQNWENAVLAMRSWRDTGRIEFLKPSGKQYGVLSHTTGLKMFQHLVDTMGLDAALLWVRTEHTGREIAEMRMASGLFSPIDKATGQVSTKVKDYLASETNLNESVLGIYGFGPKVGDFMQNSVGIDQNAVTVDLWLARTYNRLIGRLTDVAPAQAEAGGIASEIRGRAEREHIKRLVRDAAKKAGMDPSAMQAALWYFEQRLYRAHGIKSDSQNFSGAARTALQKRGIDVRPSESNQRVEGEDAGEGLLGGQLAAAGSADQARGDALPQGPASEELGQSGGLYQLRSGFYSALTRLIENSKTAKAPASQWKGMIQNAPGLKAEELEWTGVLEYLDAQDGSVTREALAAFVAGNGVQVEEVVRGQDGGTSDAVQRQTLPLIERRDELNRELEAIIADPNRVTWSFEQADDIVERDGLFFVGARRYRTRQGAEAAAQARRRQTVTPNDDTSASRIDEIQREVDDLESQIADLEQPLEGDQTKWSSFTLPGGESYREMLLTLPERAVEVSRLDTTGWTVVTGASNQWTGQRDIGIYDAQGAMRGQRSGFRGTDQEAIDNIADGNQTTERREESRKVNFKSSHWSEPNVLAHVRFKERTGPNGERVLALEEVQSDWGQQLRREKEARAESIDNDFDAIIERMKEAGVLKEVCP